MKVAITIALLWLTLLVGTNAFGQVSFQQGSFNAAVPPFGGYVPGQGATLTFAAGGGGRAGAMSFSAGQVSDRSITSQSGSITMGNGGFGMLSSGTWRPFVTGYVPVVRTIDSTAAYYPMPRVQMAAKVDSGRPVEGAVNETRRQGAIQRLIDRAVRAERAGQIQLATRYYAMAARRAEGDAKVDLEARAQKLRSRSK